MGMHEWHVRRKGETPKVVRHYRWASKMFQFVYRNPSMFRGRTLTIYNNGVPVTDVSWDEVKQMVDLKFKEGQVRSVLIHKVHEEENIYNYRGAIR